MYIKRLYIGDFGIFRNQRMDEISPGLVVIGGPNRAGKSTLMTVLNRLGYGITKNSIYPPANNKYYIEADIVNGSNNYNVRLDGYSAPSVVSYDQDNCSNTVIQDIYHVDEFTYKQLFTIALDQLVKIPPDVGSREVVRLQSILLGAGLGDIMEIDALEQQFRKKAESIGGKRGDITRKDFKPFIDMIKDGIEKKRKARSYVDEYDSKSEEIKDMDQKLAEMAEKISELKNRLDLIEILRDNSKLYSDKLEILSLLKEHKGGKLPDDFPAGLADKVKAYYESYKSAEYEYEKQNLLIGEMTGFKSGQKVIDALIENAALMDIYHERLSGIKEKVLGVDKRKEQLRNDKNDILSLIKTIDSRWGEENFDFICSKKLDSAEEARLMDAESEISKAEEQIKLHRLRLEESRAELDGLIKSAPVFDFNAGELLPKLMRGYMVSYGISLLLGIVLYLAVNPAAGIAAFLFGAGGMMLYHILKGLNRRNDLSKHNELILKRQELEQRIANYNKIIDYYLQAEEKPLDILERAAVNMGFGKDESAAQSPGIIIDRFRKLKDIQSKIIRYKSEVSYCREIEDEIAKEINNIDALLLSFEDDKYQAEQSLYLMDRFNGIINRFNRWYDILKSVKTLKMLEENRAAHGEKLLSLIDGHCGEGDLEDKVNSYLKHADLFITFESLKQRLKQADDMLNRQTNTEKVKKAVSKLKNDENQGHISFEHLYELTGTSPSDDFSAIYLDCSNELRQLEAERDEFKDRRQRLNAELERLSETTDIETAQMEIEQGKRAFLPIAYSYAVNRAAAVLCGSIRKALMDKMKGDMIANAGEILETITGGDYKSIEPGDDFESADYTFTLKDGMVQDSIDILSRGTREQVFLAVRLGRILDINPPLPVIIDDTFVNFDRRHLYNLLSVIKRLVKTHQVFIMTCHPHMIEMVSDAGIDAQYWHLDRGILTVADKDKLINYLDCMPINYSG